MFPIRRGAATEAASDITSRCAAQSSRRRRVWPSSLAPRTPFRNEVQRVQKQRHLSAVLTDWAVVAHWIPDKHPGFEFAFSDKTGQPITCGSVRVYCLI